jgi:wobble nucleotide-excising tRNase
MRRGVGRSGFGSHDEDGIAKDRVLIIDDLIASLDSEVIFIVTTLIGDYQ